MNKDKACELIEKSKQVSDELASLMDKLMPWADMREKLFRAFKKEVYPYRELVKKLPPEWEEACAGQYVAGKVLGSPARLKKFFHSARHLLSDEEEALVRCFRKNPWFYSIFTVEEQVYKDLLRVYDHVQQSFFLLCSKGVGELHRKGKRLFMSLLFNWEETCQTYGPIYYFKGFDLRDLESFADLADHYFRHTGDLSKTIARTPVPFYLLYSFAELPVTMRRKEKMVLCSHQVKAPDFDPGVYSESFDIEQKQGVYKLTLKGSEEPEYFYTVYYERKKGLLSITSMGMERYRELCSMLGSGYRFPDKPSWCVSMQMVLAIKEVLGIEPPSHQYDVLFREEPQPGADEEIDRLNAMTREMSDRYNQGRPCTVEEMARKYDLPVETVNQVQEFFQKLEKKFELDIKGGIPGFRPPPPAERMKMEGSFMENELFEFNYSKAARELFSEQVLPRINRLQEAGEYLVDRQVEFSLSDLPRLIEDLYFKYLEPVDYTILLYTLYLLHHKGEEYHTARDYAVEVLKTFWQVAVSSKGKRHLERFVRTYGVFCYAVLYRVGLIEIDRDPGEKEARKGEYRMKASSFFREWLRFDV
ncbi:MAG: hypothetical protein ACOC7U_03095 [Spirochaetota bacterium]